MVFKHCISFFSLGVARISLWKHELLTTRYYANQCWMFMVEEFGQTSQIFHLNLHKSQWQGQTEHDIIMRKKEPIHLSCYTYRTFQNISVCHTHSLYIGTDVRKLIKTWVNFRVSNGKLQLIIRWANRCANLLRKLCALKLVPFIIDTWCQRFHHHQMCHFFHQKICKSSIIRNYRHDE